MLYFYSRPNVSGDGFVSEDDPLLSFGGYSPSRYTADCAIDSALRSVPLPEGLMARLGKLAYTMSNEAADRVDYLGC